MRRFPFPLSFFSLCATAQVALCFASLPAQPQPKLSGTPAATDARAAEIVRTLHLKVLPKESGYLGIIGVSSQRVMVDGRSLAVQSQNYYMLTRERPINYLHWLAPEDKHILVEGGPVDYYVFYPDGRSEKITVGSDYAGGQRPAIVVPAGCWKALMLHPEARFALLVNTLSPEFTPDRVRIGAGVAWIRKYTNSSPWATPDFLRELVGPNMP